MRSPAKATKQLLLHIFAPSLLGILQKHCKFRFSLYDVNNVTKKKNFQLTIGTFPQVELRHFDISHRHFSVFSIPTQHATKCMSILGDLMHAHPACIECTQNPFNYTTSSIRDRIETCRSLNARMRGDVVIASCSHFTPPSREERAIPGHNARGSFHSSDMLHPLSHHLSSHDPRPVRVSNEI